MSVGDAEIVTPALLRSWSLSAPGVGKESRGHVLVVGGSRSTPGAVLLAGEAALRVGAGKLALATARSVGPSLAVAAPEAGVLDLPEDEGGSIAPAAADRIAERAEGADAVLLGPGFDDLDGALALLSSVLPEVTCPTVLDAMATAYLTERPGGVEHLAGRVVVTANLGELAKLTGRSADETTSDPLHAAAEVARGSRVVVLAGGEAKHVVAPDGRSWLVEGGSPGLGVSGSGDVQAGIVAGLLARGEEPAKAAVWGAYLHARAGERLAAAVGRVGYLARELPAVVPAVLNELG